jgi:two-component system response regulator NreC
VPLRKDTGVITVALVDDHEIVRTGLRALLAEQPDLDVVGECGDGLEALHLVERLQPDILVLDLRIGGMDGLEVTRQVAKRSPRTSIVVLSMYGNESYVVEALQAGAKAYVLKDSTTDDLIHAVREAAAGRRYLGSLISDKAIAAYLERARSDRPDPYDTLTPREREVLHLAAQGSSNAQIAERLCISRRTVEVHRSSVMHKLGLRSNVDLVRYAVDRGILPAAR